MSADTTTYAVTGTFTNNTTATTGWTLTGTESQVVVVNGTGGWGNYSPVSSISSNTQSAGVQFYAPTSGSYQCTFTQNITFSSVGSYRLTFYAQARPSVFSSAEKIQASINGYSTTAYSFSSAGSWVQQTLDFAIGTQGAYALTFTFSITNAYQTDTTIIMGAISIT